MTISRVLADWFSQNGWAPFDFQKQTWQACARGQSGLIHAATGMGKTLAVWLGLLAKCGFHSPPGRLRILWITPLRALSADTADALAAPVAALDFSWTIGVRTGDTSAAKKAGQLKKPPNLMVTTPESLSILLSHKNADRFFASLEAVVVDEWHELFGSKRGVQTELAMAHLRRLHPDLMVWGMSATMANLAEAMRHLLGVCPEGRPISGALIESQITRKIHVDALIPADPDRFPWAGHLGLKMLPQVMKELENTRSALLFTNTRSQAELWYQAICDYQPDWKGKVGIHHSSIEWADRLAVEEGLKAGAYRCVVCTSSLDLGVDFSPVDRVLQIGSPKGVARLMQRAGRSGHDPSRPSRVTVVPTHALELIEAAAVRDAISTGRIENRPPVSKPLDVLSQHLVTMACGAGFDPDALLAEVRSTASFHGLTDKEWQWTLNFAEGGNKTLKAYPQYQRIVCENGKYRIRDDQLAQRHRMGIGTIASEDAAIAVRYRKGGRIGTVEERFVNKLKPGDRFLFAGKMLEVLQIRHMTVYVKRAGKGRRMVPIWLGARMPLSTRLGAAVQEKLEQAAVGILDGPEMAYLAPLFTLQAKWSKIPGKTYVLIERRKSREGHHLYIYPFAGRMVHEGLAALFAWRLSRRQAITFTWSVNDYGMELLSAEKAQLEKGFAAELFSVQNLMEDIFACINAAEMARTRFRAIAQIAGLVFSGYPGRGKTTRQVQTSSSLLFDVFSKYDPENLLLAQANREVMERQLEKSRLTETLGRLSDARVILADPVRPTPLCFPLLVDRMRQTLSSEKLLDRVQRMTYRLEKEADL